MKQTLIFESHATSVDNQMRKASGWFDPPLSILGKKQAKELGERYVKSEPSFIFVSDLARSYETAQVAFGIRSIPIIQDARLREWNYGIYNGHPLEEVEELKQKHITVPFPQGESLDQVLERFRLFKEEYIDHSEDEHLLIIGHRAIYYAIEHWYNQIPLSTLITRPWGWQPGWIFLRN